MSKKTIFLIIAVLTQFIVNTSTAQIASAPANVQSPNVAGLGRYGEYPVSLFTGVPQINIPLYTLKEREISIPISMSYHASGFRPDEHPGWVGQGWSINAGGAITRQVNDLMDDYSYSTYQYGYYFNHDILNDPNWNSIPYMKSIAESSSYSKDTEPDQFTFNFGDYSGKFYFNADGAIKVKCDKPLKITFNDTFLTVPFTPVPGGPWQVVGGYIKSFGGFTITTEDGTQYVFGGTTDAIEYSIPFFDQAGSPWTANAWYLTKIISKNSYETVNFNYERGDLINQMYISLYSNLQTQIISNGGLLSAPCQGSVQIDQDVTHGYTGQLLSPVYLSNITTDNYKVTFVSSISSELTYDPSIYNYQKGLWNNHSAKFLPIIQADGSAYPACLSNLKWRKLDKIKVFQYGSLIANQIKTYTLGYDNSSTERLNLSNLTEGGTNPTANLPSYVFSYDNSVALPGYLADQTDHWGFFNQTPANVNGTVDLNNYFANRQPNATTLTSGTLNQITYPTGAITKFTFEPNYYSKQVKQIRSDGVNNLSTIALAGGLRVKKISSYDPTLPSQKLEKEYFYITGYKDSYPNVNPHWLSSGVLNSQIQYTNSDFETTCYNDNNTTYKQSIFSSQPVLPLTVNSFGSPVGYSEVTEKISDGSYTKYFYTNYDNGHLDESIPGLQVTRTAYEPFSSTDEERGKLSSQIVYNSSEIAVKEVDYQYTALNKNNEYVKSVKVMSKNACEGFSTLSGYLLEQGTAYKYYTYSYLPIVITTINYDIDGANPISTTETLSYDNPVHRQVTRSAMVDSKGQIWTKYNIYPQDYAAGNSFIDDMIAINNIGTPVETVSVKSAPLKTSVVTSGQIKEFRTNTGDYLSASYKLDLANPLALSSFKFSNQTIGNLPYSSTSNNPYVKDDNYNQVANYSYDHANIRNFGIYTGINTPDYISVYLWDQNRRNFVANIRNATFQQVAFTSFEEDGSVATRADNADNWVYPSANRVTDVSKTGKYSFNMANGINIVTVDILPAGSYKLTYWSKGGAATISGGSVSTTNVGIPTVDGWTFYQLDLSLTTSAKVLVKGNNNIDHIDELRLYPKESNMTTYTYMPLVGMTSSTDEKGQTTYYEYDAFQRLINIKDHNGDITKQIDYHYKGQ